MGEVMPLTPEDVSNKRFTPVRLREGYDMGEVDQFLDEVEAELARLTQENDDLRSKLQAAQSGGGAAVATPAPTPTPEPKPEPAKAPEPPKPVATPQQAPVETIRVEARELHRNLATHRQAADDDPPDAEHVEQRGEVVGEGVERGLSGDHAGLTVAP